MSFAQPYKPIQSVQILCIGAPYVIAKDIMGCSIGRKDTTISKVILLSM